MLWQQRLLAQGARRGHDVAHQGVDKLLADRPAVLHCRELAALGVDHLDAAEGLQRLCSGEVCGYP